MIIKQRKGSLLFQLSIATVILAITTAVFLSGSPTLIRSTSDDLLKDQTMLIDEALSLWFARHSGKLPDDLATLTDLDFISKDIDTLKFTYSLQNSNTEYRLTVKLNSGVTYTSLGSKF